MIPQEQELIDIVYQSDIRKKQMPIKDHQYVCGELYPANNLIILNESNSYINNIKTTSHEVMHVYYDVMQGKDLKEYEIEQLSQLHLETMPQYYKAIEDKVNMLYQDEDMYSTLDFIRDKVVGMGQNQFAYYNALLRSQDSCKGYISESGDNYDNCMVEKANNCLEETIRLFNFIE